MRPSKAPACIHGGRGMGGERTGKDKVDFCEFVVVPNYALYLHSRRIWFGAQNQQTLSIRRRLFYEAFSGKYTHTQTG